MNNDFENKEVDVFISYHGKKISDKSSYNKAKELKEHFESRNLKCFLCKDENKSDYYQEINQALEAAKHFILVACDKTALEESSWVAQEVKTFNSMINNKTKSNASMNAYIYGDLNEEELSRIFTVYYFIDVIKEEEVENGFELLYKRIINTGNYGNNNGMNKLIIIENNKQNTNINAQELSKRFLGGVLKNYQELTDNDLNKYCNELTIRLKCMSTDIIDKNCGNIVSEMYQTILKIKDKQNLMRVSGSTGVQKSYLLQLLYLTLLKKNNEHNYEPIYLHCREIKEFIEKKQLEAKQYVNDLFDNLVLNDDKIPLFIIDGLFNVVVDNFNLDYLISQKIEKYQKRGMIISVTNVFSDNSIRFNKCSLIHGNYSTSLNLTRVSLYDKDKCINYMTTLKGIDNDEALELYVQMKKSGLSFIDEHIIYLFKERLHDINKNCDIMDLFEDSLIEKLNGDTSMLLEGARIIYEYAYGTKKIDYSNKLLIKLLEIICHESIYMDCLIAIDYLDKVDSYEDNNDLKFVQMILPKEITRFVTARINRRPIYEKKILMLGEKYNELNSEGKSELSFFLGRIVYEEYKDKAIDLLCKYYDQTKLEIQNKIFDDKYKNKKYSLSEHKKDLFLLRGLSVSLIYCGNKNVLYEYIYSLINDDLSNSINRGFHLEYYGDKRYLPNQDSLDYNDNPRLGERTLRILCNYIDNHLEDNIPKLSLLLEIFTITSLLQVRIENDKKEISFPIKMYLKKAIELIDNCLNKMHLEDKLILTYFELIKDDFNKYLCLKNYKYRPDVELCNLYLKAKDVKRAGWLNQGIPSPESIVEHMYSCWFIGLIMLPNEDRSIEGYNKQRILNMLLIHDLAETKLGDIPKYEKYKFINYDEQENQEMLSLFLKSTYESIDNLSEVLSAWIEWHKYNDENARIAKDIDVIQAIYQFLEYAVKYPEKFTNERIKNWLAEIKNVKSKWGKDILRRLILSNPLFTEFILKHN